MVVSTTLMLRRESLKLANTESHRAEKAGELFTVNVVAASLAGNCPSTKLQDDTY
jgi:hypothetical protein